MLAVAIKKEPALGREPARTAKDEPSMDTAEEENGEGASGIDSAAEEFRSAMKSGSGREVAMAIKNLLAAADEESDEELHPHTRSDLRCPPLYSDQTS